MLPMLRSGREPHLLLCVSLLLSFAFTTPAEEAVASSDASQDATTGLRGSSPDLGETDSLKVVAPQNRTDAVNIMALNAMSFGCHECCTAGMCQQAYNSNYPGTCCSWGGCCPSSYGGRYYKCSMMSGQCEVASSFQNYQPPAPTPSSQGAEGGVGFGSIIMLLVLGCFGIMFCMCCVGGGGSSVGTYAETGRTVSYNPPPYMPVDQGYRPGYQPGYVEGVPTGGYSGGGYSGANVAEAGAGGFLAGAVTGAVADHFLEGGGSGGDTLAADGGAGGGFLGGGGNLPADGGSGGGWFGGGGNFLAADSGGGGGFLPADGGGDGGFLAADGGDGGGDGGGDW